ncbi:MAG: type IV toxin-antitoxin system AbiEi family antitoxin domain-containing protein [Acidimicrobiia bacterium]|nr:type IV toxin-antitoxin system AbiEi family antitoxin domain-containing protein [Acidimicrobiia bacterium]
MTNNDYRLLAERASRRYGVFTRGEAIDSGISPTTLDRFACDGRFLRVWPGVYTIAGSPDSLQQRMALAVLSIPALAALSHETAAEVWGLASRGVRRIHVVTTRWDRVRRPGVVVHESRDLIPDDVVEKIGLPVTTPARTVVDLGATKPWLVEAALETGVRKELLSLQDVESFVARVGRRGRRGVGAVRPLLEARRQWDGVTESALEDLFLKTVAELHLPKPATQYVVRNDHDEFVCRADFAYPEARVLIELDSESHHLDRLAFRRDRAKQNSAVVLGWTVLRFTWWDLKQDPYSVGARVKQALGHHMNAMR